MNRKLVKKSFQSPNIIVSNYLFAHNFENIRCTDVKVKFLECTPKITLDEYDFVKFFKKKFGTFFALSRKKRS